MSRDVHLPESEESLDSDAKGKETSLRALAYPLLVFVGLPLLLCLILRLLM